MHENKDSNMSTKVGFIGLGLMGQGMASNILKAGFDTTVHDIVRKNMDPLIKLGGKPARSVYQVAKASEVVIIMARNDSQVESIVFDEGGVLSGLLPNSTLIIMSTVSPALIRKIAMDAQRQDATVLDAAVSGIAQVASAGELTIMVGGDESVLQKRRLILEAMGNNIFYLGESGTGMVCKLLNNAIVSASIMATDECLSAGVKTGIDLEKLLQVLTTTTAKSWTIDNWAAIAHMKSTYQPDFGPLALMHKDLALLRKIAREEELNMPLISTIEDAAKNLKAT